MTLAEFAEVAGVEIQVRYVPRAAGPWISGLICPWHDVGFKTAEDDAIIGTCSGWGATPLDSMINLIQNLTQGQYKVMVIDDRPKHGAATRRVIGIPKTIERVQ